MGSNLFRVTAELHRVVQDDIDHGVKPRSVNTSKRLQHLKAICLHGGSERIRDFENGVKKSFDPREVSLRKLVRRIPMSDSAEHYYVLFALLPIGFVFFAVEAWEHVTHYLLHLTGR